ncbi:MAG: hypothetical protein R3320_11090 [Nitriliruptorales bacterium]|nr:hypothetical protein [Nitriliruptorales bacterium]
MSDDVCRRTTTYAIRVHELHDKEVYGPYHHGGSVVVVVPKGSTVRDVLEADGWPVTDCDHDALDFDYYWCDRNEEIGKHVSETELAEAYPIDPATVATFSDAGCC